MSEYEPEYLDGLQLFNEGRYWEAHDVLEQVWRGMEPADPTKRFYQALILLAAAFLHRERARTNPRRSIPPALRCFERFLTKLEGLPDSMLGMDLPELRDAAAVCFHPLEAGVKADSWPDAPVLAPK